MLLDSRQWHSMRMRNSAPEKAGRITPWGKSNNNRAHDQSSEPAFLPLALYLLPRTCNCAVLDTPLAVKGKPGLAQPRRRSREEWQRVGRWRSRGKNEGAAQPCIANNQRSATSALSTPALTVVAWQLPLKWEAFEHHLSFLLPVPCSNNGEKPGGLMLVYRDSCSKAGCLDGVPAWIAAFSQWYEQGYWAPEFSENTAEDQESLL